MLLIDKFAYTNRIKHWDPALKGFLCLSIIILQISFSNIYLHIGTFFLLSAVLVLIAKIPFKPYYKLIRIPLIFILLSLIPVFVTTNNPDYYINLFNIRIGFKSSQFYSALVLFFRVLASFSSLLFFSLTTPMQKFFARLIQLKFPRVFVEITALVYRYIFIFLEEMTIIYRAQVMRGGYDTFKNSFLSSSLLMKSLILALFKRQEEADMYLEARLFEGDFYIGEL